MADYIDDLTKLATSISTTKLPSSVVHQGRRVLIDTLGVIVGGMAEKQASDLAKQMAHASVAPCSTIWGSGHRADAMWAALAHGTAGVWHEDDGGHRFANGHLAIYVVSAGLALAERERVSGKRLLEAIIAGYEIGARVGLGTTLRPGMYSHGSWPVVGAAASAGFIMGYDSIKLRETLNVSTSLNLATSCKTVYEGATIRNVYAGFGSAMGVLAADLVNGGFTGEQDGISTVFGNLAGEYFDVERCIEGIGERWEIERGYQKLHACARDIHPAIDAMIALTKKQKISAEAIEQIEVHTYAMAAMMNDIAPKNALAARFSIPYALASYIILGETDNEAYSESALKDPRIRAIATCVTVSNDQKMDRLVPLERPTLIRVKFRNREVLEMGVMLPLGEVDKNPLSDDQLNKKFLKLTSDSLSLDGAENLLEKLWHIETIHDVRELIAFASVG